MKVLVPVRGIDSSMQRLRDDLGTDKVSIIVKALLFNTIEIIQNFDLEIIV